MLRKTIIFFLKLGVFLSVMLSLFIGTVLVGGFGRIPSFTELAVIKQSEASIVYSDDKEIIGKYFYKNRTEITYDKIPKHVIEALIATEDVRFYEHDGIDKIAMLRVLIKTLVLGNRASGGGSTISQQLAKNLFQRKDFSYLSMPVNKTKEAILANRLEKTYDKNEIIALYLNTVPFGERVYGIESAAQRYFSKSTRELSISQSAVLIGMLKANTYYNPRKHPDHALGRRNVVLLQMFNAGFLSEKAYKKAKSKPIETNYRNLLLKNPNGYFLHQIKNKVKAILSKKSKHDGSSWNLKQDGLIIETTLNSELQKSALESRKTHLIKLQKSMDSYWKTLKKKKETHEIIEKDWEATKSYKKYKKLKLSRTSIIDSAKKKENRVIFSWTPKNRNISKIDSIHHYLKMLNAAVYAIDTNSGAVQIYVGGNSYEYLPYNLIHSERQAASIFKPFVYTSAIENGQKPCDWINNEVKTYSEYHNWKPENYDHSNGGYYSMPGALAKSMNIPTIETYLSLGNAKVQSTLNSLALTKKIIDLPSTALGATTYSLQNLVHAYSAFANRKKVIEPYFINSIKTSQGELIYKHPKTNYTNELTPISKTTLETMQYLLKGVVENGTGKKLKSKYKIDTEWAGKTGTSQNYSDSWFIGFNSEFIIGSWVGCKYPSMKIPPNIGGGSIAALPIVASVISKNYKSKKTNKKLKAGFPSFDKDIVEDCDCAFYREENTLEKLLDLFDKEDKNESENNKKKEGFFSRIFSNN